MSFRDSNIVLLNTAQWSRFARSWAGTAGCSMKFEEVDTPYFDLVKRTITVRPPQFNWTEKQAQIWFGEILHEIGHADEREKPLVKKILDEGIHPHTQLFQVLNLVNDYEHEHKDHGEFKGRDRALSACQGFAASRGAEMRRDPSAKIPDTEDMKQRCMLFSWYYSLRSEWQLDVDASEWTDDFSDLEEFSSDMNELHLKCPTECYDLALRILAKLKDSTPEEVEEQAKSESRDIEEMEAQGEECEASDEQKAAGKFIAHEHGGILEEDGEAQVGRKAPIEKDESGIRKGLIDILNDETGDFNFPGTKKAQNFGGTHSSDYEPDIREAFKECSSLSSQLRRLLQVRSQSRYEPGYKRGKRLHLKSAIRNRTDATHTAVYKRKGSNNTLDNSVYLLVDGSGSMSGGRYVMAAAAAVAMNSALIPLGVRTEIGIHSDNYDSEDMSVASAFGERLSDDKLIQKMASFTGFWGNSDGSALMYALEAVLKQDTAARTIIVLSDGQPASSSEGDDREFLRAAVSTVASAGVQLFSIGIQSRSVEEYYRNRVVINRTSELPGVLLDVLKEAMID